MSANGDSPLYTAMREFIRAAVKLEVREATTGIRESLAKEVSGANLHPNDVPVRSWSGVWRETRNYGTGTMCTWNGATWLATRDTGLKPGAGDSGWKMIAKGH